MPQDTVWTGEYQTAIELQNKDTSLKQLSIHIDSGAVERIFYNAGLHNNKSPYPIFIVIIVIISGMVLFRRNKQFKKLT